MTKGQVLAVIAATPDDDVGDMLMQLAATYWLEETGDRDEVMFLFEETLNDTES